jgi:UDP-GlcNAc:undecaprenyl-phosphate GlcNAc-1-phosphate transferase
MEADKGHLHHRLMAAGLGQKRTVLTLYGISGIMGVSAILITRALWVEAGILALVAMTLIYVFIKEQEEIEVLENIIFDTQEDQKKDK